MKINKKHNIVLFFTRNDMFSNFYQYEFKYKNHTFNNSEQAFMWEKAMYFNDFEIANQILKSTHPNHAKSLGRKVKNYNDDKWSQVRFNIMRDIVFAKIEQFDELKQFLIHHKNYTFVEASPYDKIWGVKLGENDPKILDRNQWQGQNLLGEVFNLWLACYNIKHHLSRESTLNASSNFFKNHLRTSEQQGLVNDAITYLLDHQLLEKKSIYRCSECSREITQESIDNEFCIFCDYELDDLEDEIKDVRYFI